MKEQTFEHSKNILIESTSKLQHSVIGKTKGNEGTHIEFSTDGKEINDFGMRVTASSNFRQHLNNDNEEYDNNVNYF